MGTSLFVDVVFCALEWRDRYLGRERTHTTESDLQPNPPGLQQSSDGRVAELESTDSSYPIVHALSDVTKRSERTGSANPNGRFCFFGICHLLRPPISGAAGHPASAHGYPYRITHADRGRDQTRVCTRRSTRRQKIRFRRTWRPDCSTNASALNDAYTIGGRGRG